MVRLRRVEDKMLTDKYHGKLNDGDMEEISEIICESYEHQRTFQFVKDEELTQGELRESRTYIGKNAKKMLMMNIRVENTGETDLELIASDRGADEIYIGNRIRDLVFRDAYSMFLDKAERFI